MITTTRFTREYEHCCRWLNLARRKGQVTKRGVVELERYQIVSLLCMIVVVVKNLEEGLCS